MNQLAWICQLVHQSEKKITIFYCIWHNSYEHICRVSRETGFRPCLCYVKTFRNHLLPWSHLQRLTLGVLTSGMALSNSPCCSLSCCWCISISLKNKYCLTMIVKWGSDISVILLFYNNYYVMKIGLVCFWSSFQKKQLPNFAKSLFIMQQVSPS